MPLVSNGVSTQILIQSISGIELPKIGLRKILILGAVLSISPLVFYIFQISQVTGAVSFVSEYESKISALSGEVKDLGGALLRKNAASNLEIAIRKLNYEKVDRINYIQIMDSEMAVMR